MNHYRSITHGKLPAGKGWHIPPYYIEHGMYAVIMGNVLNPIWTFKQHIPSLGVQSNTRVKKGEKAPSGIINCFAIEKTKDGYRAFGFGTDDTSKPGKSLYGENFQMLLEDALLFYWDNVRKPIITSTTPPKPIKSKKSGVTVLSAGKYTLDEFKQLWHDRQELPAKGKKRVNSDNREQTT